MSISFFVWQHTALWTTGLGEGECHCLLDKVVGANHASAVREVPNPALVRTQLLSAVVCRLVSACSIPYRESCLHVRRQCFAYLCSSVTRLRQETTARVVSAPAENPPKTISALVNSFAPKNEFWWDAVFTSFAYLLPTTGMVSDKVAAAFLSLGSRTDMNAWDDEQQTHKNTFKTTSRGADSLFSHPRRNPQEIRSKAIQRYHVKDTKR